MIPATLSGAAVSLLRNYRGDIPVDDANRDACRELAAAGLLVVGHDFTRGREAFYRITELGMKAAAVLGRMPTGPSPAESASPRR
jgi:hypothetical protein